MKREIPRINLAYLKGVLDGDGFIDYCNVNPRIGLETTGKKQVHNFCRALKAIGLRPRLTRRSRRHKYENYHPFRKYDYISNTFIVRATCKLNIIEALHNLKLLMREEKIAYLKGLYDSEGCYSIINYPKRTCYHLTITNSNINLLTFVRQIIKDLTGVELSLRNYPYSTPYIETQSYRKIQILLKILEGEFY